METPIEDRRPHRPAQLFAMVSLIGAPLLLIVFLTLRHGLEPVAGARAVAALYFLGIVPGYLTQRFLFRIPSTTPFETLLSSLLLGVLVTPFLWYALCNVGMSGVFAPLMLALGVGAPIALGWHRRTGSRLRRLITAADAPILWLTLLLVVVWSFQTTLLETRDGQVVIVPHSEHSQHASWAVELSRGVPAATTPSIAHAGNWGYHYMPDVWCDMMRRAADVDPITAYFHIALPFRYLLVSLGCYLMLVGRFGRLAALAGAACMLAFVEPARFSFPKGWLSYLHYSYPTAFGLTGVLLCLYYASTAERERPRGPLLLASILSVLLLWYKANFALAVVPAVALWVVVVLVKRRDYRWLALCLGVQGLLAAIRYVELSGAELRASLVLAPWAFVQWWWNSLAMPSAAKEVLGQTLAGMPELLRWPTILAICIIHRFHIGLLVVLFLVLGMGFARRRPRMQLFDLLFVLILSCCVAGFVLFPVQSDQAWVWNVSMHVWALVSALVFALMGPALCHLVRGAMRHGTMAAAAVCACLLVGTVYNTLALRREALWATRVSSGVISEGFHACCRYIEASTAPDAVILQPKFEDYIFVSMLTQRRSVLEYAIALAPWYDIDPIAADLSRFYSGMTTEAARDLLDRYQVDYVLADTRAFTPPADESLLRKVFSNKDTTVYRVHRRTEFSLAGF